MICTANKKVAKGIELLSEEAKTMVQFGSYHDYTVNLQGIVYECDEKI